MKLKSKFWADLTWQDFTRLQASPFLERVVAVLPLAAIEQHGPHLPVSVDQTLIDGIVNSCLSRMDDNLPVLFLPTLAVGKSNEHDRFPGTLSLSAQTVIQLWMDIGSSVARAGIKKFVLLNSHGGQVSVMDIVARDLRAKYDMIVYSCSWFNLPLPEVVYDSFPKEEHRFGIHAGDIETSMMLALRPQYVNMHKAEDFKSSSQARAGQYPILGNGRSAKLGWQIQDYNVLGAVGNAKAATPVKGQALVDGAGTALAALLAEISGMPMATIGSGP
ncbi:MAG: creatininase family protein [Betaproteobacteria bacterium]|nr:creatininase family protein [Betaproteobacteria bacterium]